MILSELTTGKPLNSSPALDLLLNHEFCRQLKDPKKVPHL